MSRSPLIVAAAFALGACATTPAMPGLPKFTDADWRTPDQQNVLVIDTNRGRVLVELVPEGAPAHVRRVRALASAGVYDGRTFFRVIDRFMAQTGDPRDTGDGATSEPNLKAEFTLRRDAATPFTPVASPAGTDEGFIGPLPVISQAWSYSTMTSDQKVAAWGSYCSGVVGMARDDDPDSANSQFFIMRQPYISLDKRYTAFGRAISGLDVVRALKTGEPVISPQDKMVRVRVLADLPAAERPKVKVIDTRGPWFAAQVARVRAQKGADFSVCDIDIPAQIK